VRLRVVVVERRELSVRRKKWPVPGSGTNLVCVSAA
jgi:hypothetical protein